MASAVSPLNPGIASLLQSFASAGSPVASTLASPTVESALQNASPGDIAQLSSQAIQMQEVTALFGSPSTSTAPTSLFSNLFPTTSAATPNSILQSLDASLLSAAPASSVADAAANQNAAALSQLFADQSALQAQQVQDLFASPVNTGASPLVNVLA